MIKSYTRPLLIALSTGAFLISTACGEAEMTDSPRTHVDHLLYLVPTREQGMDEIEALLGVRPAPGGRHPQYGTHNALLSLGEGVYFEVIARDPELPVPAAGVLFDADKVTESRLVTWVLRADDFDNVVAAAEIAGLGLGAADPGHRERPDGSRIEWIATDPSPLPMDGVVPFLINWGNSPHPSGVAPPAGEFLGLRIEHPEVDKVREAMAVLGADVEVVAADAPALVTRIRTAAGVVEVR